RRRLNMLLSDEREQWFRWVDTGPDMMDIDAPTEEYARQWIENWKFEKLYWVREHLDSERRELYKELLSRHGEPEDADVNVRVSIGWHGDESPLSVQDLSAGTFEQAVDAVSSWRPEGSQFTGPSFT